MFRLFAYNYSLFNDHSQDKTYYLNYIYHFVVCGGESVIDYRPFWDTLKQSSESTYTLIHRHHISSSTIDKLRKNKPLNTTTINDLCRILNCNVDHIMKYIPSDEDQVL